MVWNDELKREIPEGWEVYQLDELFRFVKGRIPTEVFDTNDGNNLIPYLTIEAVNALPISYCKKQGMITTAGDTIMVMDGAASSETYVGHYGALGSTFAKLEKVNGRVTDSFVYVIMQKYQSVFKKVNTGSTVPHANKDYISKFKVVLPKDDCLKNMAIKFDTWVQKQIQVRDCIDDGGKLTKRLRETIQKDALNNTFTSVAERYGFGATTVATAFESYTDILRLRPDVKAPRVLGLDECHLQKQMRPVYVDLENAIILEMGRSVKKDDVTRDLLRFKNLDKVEVATTDMCAGYKSAIEAVLPQAIHVVDKFHVVKLFLESVESARKMICDDIRKKIEAIPNKDKRQAEWDRFTELNIDSYMFKMNPENMADWRLNKLVEICDAYHEFRVLATLRDLFFQIYKAENRETAHQAYWKWKGRIPRRMDEYAEMRRIANRTFKTWENEIFNYFDVEGRKTNATTERLNGAIKSMQNMGRGYSYEVLRAKMLFGSQTSKAPLYQRPSQLLESNDSSLADVKPSETDKLYLQTSSVGQELDDMMKNIPFEVHPTDGGGVIEAPGYYCGKEDEAQPLSGFDLLMFNEMHMHDEVKPEIPMVKQEAKVRNPDLELVQNGGAPIDSIIKYYQEHGECI